MKTNITELQNAIDRSGLRNSYLAEKCHLSRTSFYKKKKGEVEWTASEIGTLRSELKLTLTQTKDIFLL